MRLRINNSNFSPYEGKTRTLASPGAKPAVADVAKINIMQTKANVDEAICLLKPRNFDRETRSFLSFLLGASVLPFAITLGE